MINRPTRRHPKALELYTTEARGAYVFQAGDDFAKLWAQIELTDGPVSILFDDSTDPGNLTIPAQAGDALYDFGRCTFIGAANTEIGFALNAIASVPPGMAINCTFQPRAATPCFRIAAGVKFENQTYIGCEFQGGTIAELLAGADWFPLLIWSDIQASAVITVAAGASFVPVLTTGSSIPADIVTGAGDGYPAYDSSSTVGATQAGLGSWTLSALSSSPGLAYTPTTGTDWPDPDPVNVQEALDDLAARVTAEAYAPAAGADWTDPDPTTVSGAIDRIAAAVAGLLLGPIP